MTFKNRFDAAYQLIQPLKQYKDNPDTLVLAVPRGGVELGFVLSRELQLPLEIVLAKKIGYPGNPEYAIGAAGLTYSYVAPEFQQFQSYIDQEIIKIRKLLQDRAELYYKGDKQLSIKGKTVIVVDDGVATGNTLLATLAIIKHEQPKKIIVALPVAPASAIALLQKAADEVICLQVPEVFFGVGQFYQEFHQVDDSEVIKLLDEARL